MFTSTKARQALILAGGLVLQECMLREYRDYFRSKIYFSSSYLQDYLISSELTFLVKEESDGNRSPNGMYKAIEIYLSAYAMSDASSSARKFGVYGDFDIRDDETFERRAGEDGSNPLQLTFESGEKVADSFEGIKFIWQLSGRETQRSPGVRSFNLTFPKRYKEIVFNKYLPHIVNRSIDRSKALREESRKLKLYHSKQNRWKSTTLRHQTDFANVAMDEGKKTALIDDLVRFVERKERIGRAWKRGYLLYGPPGTGKTTLVAAMANYLKFDIYDLELTGVKSISDLRWLLTNTTSRSILVIEDIDCAMDAQCQRDGSKDSYYDDDQDKITLSGLLNTIDGLGSYQNERIVIRIVIFTTNYKDRLDAALLRPGRMDMHIYMGYCDPAGFRVLALNYLSLTEHQLFGEIDELLQKIEITPAEVAETLIRNEIAENALQGLIDVLNEKMTEIEKKMIEEMKNIEEQTEEEGEEEEEKDEEKEKDGENNVQMKRNNSRIVGQQFLFFMIFSFKSAAKHSNNNLIYFQLTTITLTNKQTKTSKKNKTK
ncbi:hypothetical protein LUZ60_010156 [Juncus effusus]|nr:hypothetical protein LUZ60_010156 [Juncus effusus]